MIAYPNLNLVVDESTGECLPYVKKQWFFDFTTRVLTSTPVFYHSFNLASDACIPRSLPDRFYWVPYEPKEPQPLYKVA